MVIFVIVRWLVLQVTTRIQLPAAAASSRIGLALGLVLAVALLVDRVLIIQHLLRGRVGLPTPLLVDTHRGGPRLPSPPLTALIPV